MALSLDDAVELWDADVFDAKGEFIGSVRDPHMLNGELIGVFVELDDAIASLPTVGRDRVEIASRYCMRDGDANVRVAMDLMEAVTGHVPPRLDRGREEAK